MTDLLWLWDSPKLNELAEANFKRFVAVLCHLIMDEQLSFDLQIAGGNTGLVMSRYAQMVFERLGKPRPPLLKAATRWTALNQEDIPADDTVLRFDFANQIRDANLDDGRRLYRVLFVDDEITQAVTSRSCMRLLGDALGKREFELHIIAEDHFFQPAGFPPEFDLHFHPFSKGIKGFCNIVLYWLPWEVESCMTSRFSDEIMPVQIRHAVLLDLPSRDKTVPLSGFTYQMNQTAREQVPELAQVKVLFTEFANRLIDEGIEDYRSGKVNLQDHGYRERILISTP
jgi:hypothetical protein